MDSRKSGMAQTVLGAVSTSQLGITLTHEHLLFDFSCYWKKPFEASAQHLALSPVAMPILGELRMNPLGNRDNLFMGDEDAVTDELMEFVVAGGNTVVDVTLDTIGRDPKALRRLALRTGLNVIMGCGYYIHLAHPANFEHRTKEDIAEELVTDLMVGVRGSGIRAGIIGEIGVSLPMVESEEKSLRAAATAQRETGAPLSVHIVGYGRQAMEVLGIIAEEGGDLSHVVLCHMNPSFSDQEYQQQVAESGAYLGYDMIGLDYRFPTRGWAHPGTSYSPATASSGNKFFQAVSDSESAAGIAALVDAGYQDQILLSHDIFVKTLLKRYGGMGYAHILRNFVPLLMQRGLMDENTRGILVDNPARFLQMGGLSKRAIPAS